MSSPSEFDTPIHPHVRETHTAQASERQAELDVLLARHALAEAEERLAAIRGTATPKSAELAKKEKGRARKASLEHDTHSSTSHEPTPEPVVSSCTFPCPPPPPPIARLHTSNKKCNSVRCERLRDRRLGKNWKLACGHCLDHGPPKTKQTRTSLPTAKRATIQLDATAQVATKNNVASTKAARKNAKVTSQRSADELAELAKPKVLPSPIKRLLPIEFARDPENELPKPKARRVLKSATSKGKEMGVKANGERKPTVKSPSPFLSGSGDNSDGAEEDSDDVIADESSEVSDNENENLE